MRVFISGPMRGREDFNFPAFDAMRDKLVSLGYEVVSPADMDRENGFDGTKSKFSIQDYKKAMVRDIQALATCHAIVMLPGWNKSKGSFAELLMANAMELKVFSCEDIQEQARTSRFHTMKPVNWHQLQDHDLVWIIYYGKYKPGVVLSFTKRRVLVKLGESITDNGPKVRKPFGSVWWRKPNEPTPVLDMHKPQQSQSSTKPQEHKEHKHSIKRPQP